MLALVKTRNQLWGNSRCSTDNRDEVPVPTDFDAQNAEAGLLTMERHTLNRTGQVFHGTCIGGGRCESSHRLLTSLWRGQLQPPGQYVYNKAVLVPGKTCTVRAYYTPEQYTRALEDPSGGALVKRGHLMLPAFGALRTFGAPHVPGPLPVAELSRCLQARSLAFGRCQSRPHA